VSERKGIILAGGDGTRLYPVTMGVSKQLIPVYDKPMIFYSVSVLMLAGIRDIAIITTRHQQAGFRAVLGDGLQWGISFTYLVQDSPDGLAQAYLIAEDFLGDSMSALILGDNLFFGAGLQSMLRSASARLTSTVFGYEVRDPERYGVVAFDEDGCISAIVEKPSDPPSSVAVTGLYFLDQTASRRARSIKPSARGELEITSLLETYLDESKLQMSHMGRGFAWLDTGTHESLLDASNFVRTLEKRQGLLIGCPEEIAYRSDWIDRDKLMLRASLFKKNDYGRHLRSIAGDA